MALGVLISLNTGLRVGEVCALAWEDVDFDEEILHIRHTVSRVQATGSNRKTRLILDAPKTKASRREIPISTFLFPALLEAHSKTVSRFVVSGKSDFANPRTFELQYHKLLAQSGVPQLNYHALRHTFATRCIEAGVDMKSLSEILGHGSVSITLETYVHSSIQLKRAQLEKLKQLSK